MLTLLVHALLLGLMAASICYTLTAAWLVGSLRKSGAEPATVSPGVTLLKPLHGAEPRLRDNLATFCAQDFSGEIQFLCGVVEAGDPAGSVARSLGAELVTGSPRIGTNGKISNLLGMMPRARHDVLVLSDSDMSVPPDYLSVVVGALAANGQVVSSRARHLLRSPSVTPDSVRGPPVHAFPSFGMVDEWMPEHVRHDDRGQAIEGPQIGAVTCLYRGRGDAGPWSALAAAGLSYHFLPSVVLGLALGRAKPCMGSTIALRRTTLDAIGGFERFADRLADDFEIGQAVRALGLTVAVPPLVLTHGCADASLRAVVRHELRWAATVRLVDPRGYAGTLVTHPLPLAILAACVIGGAAWWLVAVALAARWLLVRRVDRIVGEPSAPLWMLPERDLLSGALFVAGLFVRRVEWRGERHAVAADGRMGLVR